MLLLNTFAIVLLLLVFLLGHFIVFELLDFVSRAGRHSGSSGAVYLHRRHLSGRFRRPLSARDLVSTGLRVFPKKITVQAQRSTHGYVVVYDDGLL